VIYFDAAYIAKCYLNEPGADLVRQVAYRAEGLASCEVARLEFACIVRRHLRERHVTRREATAIMKDFEQDEKSGVWHWFGMTPVLVEQARQAVLRLPRTVFLRAGDALHLACAHEHGFRDVYTNDHHMLEAAPHFQLAGVNVIKSS
jgi:predicted nucleic acid-binding protein